jgi:hypothetical protein
METLPSFSALSSEDGGSTLSGNLGSYLPNSIPSHSNFRVTAVRNMNLSYPIKFQGCNICAFEKALIIVS